MGDFVNILVCMFITWIIANVASIFIGPEPTVNGTLALCFAIVFIIFTWFKVCF